jgi:hypothetical protein
MLEENPSYVFHTFPPGRRPRTRYLADALEFFVNRGETVTSGRIKLTSLPLPRGDFIIAVAVLFPEIRSVLSMGPSKKFRARIGLCDDVGAFDIDQLNGATLSSDGSVTLCDGLPLRAVELLLNPHSEKLSNREETIVRLIVEQTDSNGCYRNLAHEVPDWGRTQIPELSVLDYGRVRQIKAPPFKTFLRFLNEQNPDWDVSREKYSQTLIKCGLRQHRTASATI